MGAANHTLLLILTVGLVAGVAEAQQQARMVEGSVTYHGGEIAPQATVQIEDVESKQVISCVTDDVGRYSFKSLKMDKDYTLRASKNGHWSDVHHLTKFSGKHAETVNLRLKEDADEK